jgi:hypothetical protein
MYTNMIWNDGSLIISKTCIQEGSTFCIIDLKVAINNISIEMRGWKGSKIIFLN